MAYNCLPCVVSDADQVHSVKQRFKLGTFILDVLRNYLHSYQGVKALYPSLCNFQSLGTGSGQQEPREIEVSILDPPCSQRLHRGRKIPLLNPLHAHRLRLG